ncbi:complement C1q-like protein 3 [Mytilus trossulus]|uniref:complement C1q-like protein 3 n=1 Tax=Mytilus trossulus TaxID=6551 RepID=UPI0030060FA0
MAKAHYRLLFMCFLLNVGASTVARKRLLLDDPAAILNRLDQLEKTVLNQTKELDQLKRTQNDTKPAFFAVLLVSGENFGNEQILKFDSVKTNIEGGYDPITGVFIAPKDGTYQFTGVIYSNGQGADIEAQMNKNHELLLKGYSSGSSHAESLVMSGVVTLKTGDHIFIQHRGPAVDNARGDSHSSFSGFMI